MVDISKIIGKEIYKNRKARSITREELAKSINVSQSLIQQFENGSTKISLPILYQIYHILKFSIDDLFDRIKKEEQEARNKDNKYVCANKLDSLRILMIEDNIVDQMVFSETLKEINIKTEFTGIQNGDEALNLINEDNFDYDIIFLDINLPKRDGIDILRSIKGSDSVKNIPVIIYTSSILGEDMKKCYKMGCNGYLIKTLNNETLKNNLLTTMNYWIHNIIR